MKQNPSILLELRDLMSEVATALHHAHIEEALAYIEQFIVLERDGAFSAESKVLEGAVWDVHHPSEFLDARKITQRMRMKAYTDPDVGGGYVMMLHGSTGVKLPEHGSAVIAYLTVGEVLTYQEEYGKMLVAHHKEPATLRGKELATVSVGVTLSDSHHGRCIQLPAEPHVVLVTSEWVGCIPAEKKLFSLDTFEGGGVFSLKE